MYYLISGASGFLGRYIAEKLLQRGEKVGCLVLQNDRFISKIPPGAKIVNGDILSLLDLERLFALSQNEDITFIHCAGIISIKWSIEKKVKQVNINGTANVIDMCLKYNARLLHVSSVHSMPEKKNGEEMSESTQFSRKLVKGGYAKTKAEATNMVVDAIVNRGLRACIFFPSGIAGPKDYSQNNLSQMMIDYAKGKIPFYVKGGYAFCDVRDVSDAIINACYKKEANGCFILSSEYVSIEGFLRTIHKCLKNKPKEPKLKLPAWIIVPVLPLISLYYLIKKQKPVVNFYSLYTLNSNGNFTNRKAKEVLNFNPRPFYETIKDSIEWLENQGKIG